MRSSEPDTNKGIKLLRKDLQNGPYHCFGHHTKCNPDFCLTAKERMTDSLSHRDQLRDPQNHSRDEPHSGGIDGNLHQLEGIYTLLHVHKSYL